jgi:glycosyltransferase involved in cell wall biosynthesis
MKKIRVLHLITRLPIGGAERLLIGVLRTLDTESFESVVCCIMDRGELAVEVEALGVPLVSLGLMQKHGFDRKVVPALCQLMRDQRIDIVHTHLYHANLYGRLAARNAKLPAIASVHNTYSRPRWHRLLINRFLARGTYRITAGSREIEEDILRYDKVAVEKVVRLTNCVDLDRVGSDLSPAQAKTQLGFAPDDTVIGCVGRMEEQKGHGYLLEAFAQLCSLPHAPAARLRLLVVGDGRLKQTLHDSAARLGIAHACRFPGSISRLADVYRGIDIFVMPSLWEGLSLAMLEAMAAGLPMIATAVGGTREVIGETDSYGIVVPPADPQALALAIERLLMNPALRRSMGESGAQHVRSRYDVVSQVRQLEAIYRQAYSHGTTANGRSIPTEKAN